MKHERNSALNCSFLVPQLPFSNYLTKKISPFILSWVGKSLPLGSGIEHPLFQMIDVCRTDHGTFTLPFIKIGKLNMYTMCKILDQILNQCN